MIEDTNLIQEVLNKNAKAEEIFFTKYRKIIKDYLKHKFSKYNFDIEDSVSDILIKVYENLNKYDSKFSFRTWVLAIAKNYMIDTWRSKAIVLTTYNSNFIDNDDDYYTTTSVNAEYCENSNYTVSCDMDFENNSSLSYVSAQISPEEYALLTMKYVQGYDYCEIGSEFNASSNTISNRINYIKTKLKKNSKLSAY
jgi:RNA polymerase sigma-70 factor (ECF subfamily)